jgi:hypothetical protein
MTANHFPEFVHRKTISFKPDFTNTLSQDSESILVAKHLLPVQIRPTSVGVTNGTMTIAVWRASDGLETAAYVSQKLTRVNPVSM